MNTQLIENKITHDELIEFGFKLNFPNHPQAFYSFEMDDDTQFYYSNNKLSLFKKHIGNVHQFKNINSFEDIYHIIGVFVKDECWCYRKLKKCKGYIDCLQMNTKTETFKT